MKKKVKIIAIGGAVIKTAWEEIKEAAERRLFDVLIHNGGSLFHDFQRAADADKLTGHSYSLDELLENYKLNEKTSKQLWNWILHNAKAPKGSLTSVCEENKIKVLMFTAMGTDFFQLFNGRSAWEALGGTCYKNFGTLCDLMTHPFHFICMGSAVIHPEVFAKAMAVVKPKEFRADAVDFLDMYRPRTRVAKYGHYYKMTHKEYLTNLLKGVDMEEKEKMEDMEKKD